MTLSPVAHPAPQCPRHRAATARSSATRTAESVSVPADRRDAGQSDRLRNAPERLRTSLGSRIAVPRPSRWRAGARPASIFARRNSSVRRRFSRSGSRSPTIRRKASPSAGAHSAASGPTPCRSGNTGSRKPAQESFCHSNRMAVSYSTTARLALELPVSYRPSIRRPKPRKLVEEGANLLMVNRAG